MAGGFVEGKYENIVDIDGDESVAAYRVIGTCIRWKGLETEEDDLTTQK
jgi:hypothetical protein